MKLGGRRMLQSWCSRDCAVQQNGAASAIARLAYVGLERIQHEAAVPLGSSVATPAQTAPMAQFQWRCDTVSGACYFA
jgi:hypothetical protein